MSISPLAGNIENKLKKVLALLSFCLHQKDSCDRISELPRNTIVIQYNLSTFLSRLRKQRGMLRFINLEFGKKWEKGNSTYTQQQLDEVRNEWPEFVFESE
ncbi:unnamed protein product [Prunus armeniaca]|uniref:Uncharacterized protein n=1 Tax=Prunus armeniaca TaxID=36596 RepID=A0A6J5UDL0_PRUAR|nr:unnamed protein product [Prunus armeniaca]